MDKMNEFRITEQQKQETDSTEAVKILKTNYLTPKDEATDYFCTVRQFAYYIEETPSEKKKIVFNQKNPRPKKSKKDVPLIRYKTTLASIRHALNDNNTAHIYEGIAKLKKLVYKPKQTFKISDRDLSIKALEEYKEFSLSLAFRDLKKIKIPFNNTPLKVLGVNIKISPDYVFRANYKGQSIVGAIRINIKKIDPFSSTQMKVVSYLLQKFVEKHVASEGDIVLPEFCICVDVFDKKCTSAPSRTEAPVKLINDTCKEYSKQWDETEKVIWPPSEN